MVSHKSPLTLNYDYVDWDDICIYFTNVVSFWTHQENRPLSICYVCVDINHETLSKKSPLNIYIYWIVNKREIKQCIYALLTSLCISRLVYILYKKTYKANLKLKKWNLLI